MRNSYSISEFIRTSWALLLTKVFFSQARLIRRPIFIRGKKSIIGARGLTTGYNCRFDLKGSINTLFIGDNCELGDNVHIVAYENVTIGNNVLIASKVFISDTNHGVYKGGCHDSPYSIPNERKLVTNPVKIGKNVWIGENVVILAGAQIGDGCIIGANSVVNTKIPNGSIVVGAPGKVVKAWHDSTNSWEKVK